MLDGSDNEDTQPDEVVVKTKNWNSKCFDRPGEDEIKLKRYSYSRGTFMPEYGPHYIATAFANENH